MRVKILKNFKTRAEFKIVKIFKNIKNLRRF